MSCPKLLLSVCALLSCCPPAADAVRHAVEELSQELAPPVTVAHAEKLHGLKELKHKLDDTRQALKRRPKSDAQQAAADFGEEFLVGSLINGANGVVPGSSVALNVLWNSKDLIPSEEEDDNTEFDWCEFEYKNQKMYMAVAKVGQVAASTAIGICLSPFYGAAFGAGTSYLMNLEKKHRLQQRFGCRESAQEIAKMLRDSQEKFDAMYAKQAAFKLQQLLAELPDNGASIGFKQMEECHVANRECDVSFEIKELGPGELSINSTDGIAVARRLVES
eukprot:TRINITY_DN39517_c0_g1_i1.p1 TRINITY_DN39517_c0_g1~~TRINITY_DN39517_c0_g1_i1.p1  ORF type:complete len:277 (+),score=70.14 TRINITY_DN39517_c0_g1_i1:71-901(+)